MFGIRADRNATGMVVLADGTAIILGVNADGNTIGDGIDVLAAGTGDDAFPVPGTAMILASISASNNAGTGLDLTAPNGGIIAEALIAVMNGADGVRIENLKGGAPAFVTGSVICDNAVGLRLLANVSLDAEGDWWGRRPTRCIRQSPGGSGNAVADGANGGSGTVDFIPFIDTITATFSGPHYVGAATTIDFQFSGGNGTVFLGLQPPLSFFPFFFLQMPGPPFAITTDNGVLTDDDETASTVHTIIDAPNGTVRVVLHSSVAGAATVTLDGPCNLDGSVTVPILRARPAPLLGAWVLGGLCLGLLIVGCAAVRRHN
jgi:hypothetical protein